MVAAATHLASLSPPSLQNMLVSLVQHITNPPAQYQNTPLHLAAEYGLVAACRVLIKAGANVDAIERVSLP